MDCRCGRLNALAADLRELRQEVRLLLALPVGDNEAVGAALGKLRQEDFAQLA